MPGDIEFDYCIINSVCCILVLKNAPETMDKRLQKVGQAENGKNGSAGDLG